MTHRSRFLFLIVFAAAAATALPHEGHDHSAKGARIQFFKTGPAQNFDVAVGYLPEAPVAGQNVQFLARIEETAGDDPLLGGRVPLSAKSVQASIAEEGKNTVSIKPEPAGEAGLYRFEHVFPSGGRWDISLQFESTEGALGQTAILIPVKEAPGRWAPLALQAFIALASVGLVVQRFKISPARSAVISSLAIALAGGTAFALVHRYWPSGVPPVTGELEAGMLVVPEEQPLDLASVPEGALASELALETPALDGASVLAGTVRYATSRVAQVSNPSPGTVVYKQGVPKIGDRVKAGQVLATIQNRFNLHDAAHLLNLRWDLVKATLQSQEAKVTAEADHQRATGLFELGVISKRELQIEELRFNTAVTADKEAQARLKLHDSQIAESNLKEVEIRSPINGYITRANYSSGQMIYEGDVLFEIGDPSVLWVEALAFPQSLSLVEGVTAVTLRSAVFPDRRFSGKRINILVDADPESRALRVLYEVPNPDLWLKPGMQLSVHLDNRPRQATGAPAGTPERASPAGPPPGGSD